MISLPKKIHWRQSHNQIRAITLLIDRFIDIFGVWEQAIPYLHLIVDEDEMTLVVLIDEQAEQGLTSERVAGLLGWDYSRTSQLLRRALHAICNCCACDCYPCRAAQELGSNGVWPKSQYLAAHGDALCNHCGGGN